MGELAGSIASRLDRRAIIQIDGPLGAGKTHFVKGLAAALGYPDNVASPTFPIVHEYRWADQLLVHMDFYRLQSVAEVLDAGLEEYLPCEGITVVEWASRFSGVFPPGGWKIEISILDETNREVTIESPDY